MGLPPRRYHARYLAIEPALPNAIAIPTQLACTRNWHWLLRFLPNNLTGNVMRQHRRLRFGHALLPEIISRLAKPSPPIEFF
jgi:hypothetical protein